MDENNLVNFQDFIGKKQKDKFLSENQGLIFELTHLMKNNYNEISILMHEFVHITHIERHSNFELLNQLLFVKSNKISTDYKLIYNYSTFDTMIFEPNIDTINNPNHVSDLQFLKLHNLAVSIDKKSPLKLMFVELDSANFECLSPMNFDFELARSFDKNPEWYEKWSKSHTLFDWFS